MTLYERLASFLQRSPAQRPQQQALFDALEAARRAKYAEDYPRAREGFEQVLAQAQAVRDGEIMTRAVTQLAEVLLRMGRADEAQALLERMKVDLTADVFRAALLTTEGMLAQVQDDWARARLLYEQSVDLARDARATALEGRAIGHLAETYLRENNAAYAVHLLRDALPKLTHDGDGEQNTVFVGLLGKALIQAGQEVEGLHLLNRALQLAEQVGYRVYERRWALELGARAMAEARYHDARVHYLRALRVYDESKPDAEYVTTLSALSRALLSLRDYSEARAQAQKAFEAAQALNDPQLTLMARGTLGVALRSTGRSAESIPHLQAAAESVDGVVQVEVLRSLGAAQADSGDLEKSISIYRRAIQRAEQLGEPLEVAQSHRDLGLVYLKARQMPTAIQEWQQALAIYEERKAYAQAARLYCDIGNARKALGQGQRAMKDYEQALMALNSVDEHDLETRGLVLSNAANAYAEQGDVESADSFFNEAITLADRLGDKVAESTRSGNYGWFLLMVGRPRRAISTLERALRLSQAQNLPLQTAVQTDNLGLAHDALGDYATAQEQHQTALTLIEPLEQPYWKATFQINLGNTLLALAQVDNAIILYDEALAYGRTSENVEIIVRALTGKAQVALRVHQPESADEALTDAIALARRADLRRLLAEALSVRSQQQAALGRPDEAHTVWEEAQRLYTILHMPQAKAHPAWLT